MSDGPGIEPLMQRLETLERDLADLKAKEEIRDLFNRYGFTADCGDAQGYA